MNMSQIDKYEALGLNIAFYRKKRKLSQEDLAEILGLDRTHIGKIEIAKGAPSLDVVFRIADALEIPAYKLFEFRD